MGLTFSKGMGAHPLAIKLLKDCKRQLEIYDKMLENKINRNMIFHYVNKKLIPSVNYGAYYDSPD
ncbi:MAG: hypothetical protein EOM50_12745 [Erysipelotrichia bacterium]|nr:hypothetical protein [Erysipelotrichia bacterium]